MPKRTVLTVLFVMAAACLFAQQKPIDNALLWKVTGNNLTKPSFLYGTIHVYDRRVFNFSDSLYSSLQSADGYAMEIHPDSVLIALMQKMNEETSSEYIKKYLKKDEYEELNTKFRKEFGFDADRVTVKETYMLKQRLARPERKADDMPTIVDAYLYGMAKNQGKEIAGLENAMDHINLINDLNVQDFDVKKILKNLKKEQSLTDKLIQLYIKEDLKGIEELMGILPDQTEDKLLNLRNQLMVERMDSLIRQKSYVVAVGTAHLPGTKGMITLLKQKGYTVEPVFTTSRTHASKYAVKAQQQLSWIDVKEPSLGYSARMPGKPNPMEMLNGAMKMNMYMDLTSMKQYYTAFVLPSVNITRNNADSVLQSLYKNIVEASLGESVSNKRFTKGEFEAIDMLYRIPSENTHARVQSFAHGRRVYIIGMGASKREDLYATEASDYFNAFIIESMPEQQWQQHTYNDHFCTIRMPGNPKPTAVEGADSTVNAVQYLTVDNSAGTFYGLMIATTNPGYVIPDDSAYFESAAQRLTATLDIKDLQQRDTVFLGFNARWITGALKDGSLLQCLSINRGNRLYSLIMTGHNDHREKKAIDFFNSFSFIEYPRVKWTVNNVADLGFSVPAGSVYSNTKFQDEYYARNKPSAEREYIWTGYDSVSATTFTVTREPVSPYLWAKHDSIVLKKYMDDFVSTGDGYVDYLNVTSRLFGFNTTRKNLKGYRFIKNGGVNGIEFTVEKPNSNHTSYVRILLNGKGNYTLHADVPATYWKKYGFEKFMEGFRFVKEESTDYLRTNSFQKLLTDLNSKDSATYAGAFHAIEHLIYDSTDIPLLLAAGSDEYPLDTLAYATVGEQFFEVAGEMKHANFNKLVADHYKSLKPSQQKAKYGLLTLLAQQKTAASYSLLAELMQSGMPASGRSAELVYALDDSLELTKTLLPLLPSLNSDTVFATKLFSVYKRLVDSNVVSLQELKKYEPYFLQSAQNELALMQSDTDEFYYAAGQHELLNILGQFNTERSVEMLRRFVRARHISAKYSAAVELLKLKQPVDQATLQAVAEDNYYRIDLYTEMEKLGMQRSYPVKYNSQQAFAEAYLNISFDDFEGKTEYVGERTVVFNGQKKKFFLFKVYVEYYDDEKATYLGVSGPFDAAGKKVLLDNDTNISGIFADEEYKKSAIDRHFRLYLLMHEKEEDIRIGTMPPPEIRN